MKRKPIIEGNLYYCHHISEEDKEDVLRFTVETRKGPGIALQDYIRNIAIPSEREGLTRTYLVRSKKGPEEIVGYFSLQCGLVSVDEKGLFHRSFDSIPGVEMSNFAINSSYIQKHPQERGVGHVIFTNFVLPVVDKASETVGISILYIFALPAKTLIDRYRAYGFSRLNWKQERSLHRRIKPRYDQGCIFMYIAL